MEPSFSTQQISSELPGFFKKSGEERLKLLGERANLSKEELDVLQQNSSLDFHVADKMIENAVGTFPLPLGIATNFKINSKDYLIPMAIEEPSVIAAASYGAKLAREGGGFTVTHSSESLMIAQIQLVSKSDWTAARENILAHKESVIALANAVCPSAKGHGGGAKDLEARIIETKRGDMLIIHLIVDVGNVMGANILTRMAEGVTPLLEELSFGGKARLRILSNLAVHRLFRAEAIWTKQQLVASCPNSSLTADDIIDGILDAWAFAEADPFRAATNNKGILNGIDAVAIATGNDFRAIESGAHAYSAFNKDHYSTLTHYERTPEGDLKGVIEIPLALGIAGGVTQVHPVAKVGLKVIGAKTSGELGAIFASVGLAQNFAALRAMTTEGLVRGHMKLHAKNVAMMGGAQGSMVDLVAHLMTLDGVISTSRAKEILSEICNVM